MKTPDKIKKGLQYCSENTWCVGSECPYYEITDCDTYIAEDALALIEQLERERDAAVAELKGYGCTYCKYLMRPSKHKCGKKCVDFCNWEWCGVKEKKDG